MIQLSRCLQKKIDLFVRFVASLWVLASSNLSSNETMFELKSPPCETVVKVFEPN